MLIGDCLSKLTSTAIAIILLLVSAGVAGAEVTYVEPGTSIQAAVNNSTTGDFVIVKAGDYEENIIVNVSGVTVTSETENPDAVFIRAKDDNSSVFLVKADNVTISGFNITGSGEFFSTSGAANFRDSYISRGSGGKGITGVPEAEQDYLPGSGEIFISRAEEFSRDQAGICLDHVENCTIEKNYVFENQYGIYLKGSMNNSLLNNTLLQNGIWIDEGCSNNKAINNSIEEGNFIIGAHCWDNVISQNLLLNGGGIGIACCGGGNLVSNNEIINCSTGIDIYDTQARTVLCDNLIKDCDYGIYLILVYDSRVSNNTISNSSRGVFLRENSQSNELFNNTITSSNESGIYLMEDCAGNRIYNNYFNNTVNVKAENSEGNIWNTTKTPGINILGGPYIGGNFWADLNGTGFSQTAEDSDSDGICDLPYNVNGSDFDYLPLTEPPSAPEVSLKIIVDESLKLVFDIPENCSERGIKKGSLNF
ncbi:NosD domain-containing protein [Methanosarcina hadiensis]|uniref:right-handed parallel beta-helix repeat-containing protein n=1 Tax=Methanosarcina hadiensis TaxID=3078083 RepID=UPI003977DB1D